MGCTSGKTSNPNKNLSTNQVQQKPVQNNNMAIQPNGRNMDSKIPNQLPVNNGTTTPTNVLQKQRLQQNIGQLNKMGLNPVSNQHGNEPLSMQNPLGGSSNNQKQSQIIQNNQYAASPHKNNNPASLGFNGNSPASSGLKPNLYQMHDTTDDEIVNQQKTMDFDLGIKFNMQIEVE